MKLEEARKRLLRRYLDGIRGKIAVVEQGLREFDDGGDGAIRRLSHQIAGSAGSFGLPELGKVAAKAERAEPDALKDAASHLLDALHGVLADDQQAHPDVLVVDDDVAICEEIKRTLSQCVVLMAHTVADARRMMADKSFDLVLLDVMLPDGDGRALLGQLRADPATEETPVIIMSHKTNSLVRNECSAHGIEGYLEKPIDLQSLPNIVASVSRRHQTFQHKAYDDSLTSLLNRAGFRKHYTMLASLCRRNERPISLALLDLDRFKSLNDTFGHEIGDVVLRLVANLLRENLRGSDIVGRWGGEEFVIAMPETDLEGAEQTLTKLADLLREQPLTETYPRKVTYSAGLAQVREHESLDQAINRADQGLYAAKAQGRDRVLSVPPVTGHRALPTVLLAEDDMDVAFLLLQDLAEVYDVTHVTCGEQALAMAAKQRYDLLIFDHHLPGATGVDIAESLRSSRASQGALFVLTTEGNDDVVERAFKAGAVDFITKPYRKRDLLARLGRHLGR